MEKLIQQLDWLTEELTANSLANQRCDITGWNLTESMAAIAFELKEIKEELRNQK